MATPEPSPTTDQTIYYGNCTTCNTQLSTPGATVTVNAQGYAPHETVIFVLHSSPVTLGTAVADEHGDVTNAVFTIPTGTVLGSHVIIATGGTSSITKVLGVTLSASVASTTAADLADTGYNSGLWLSEAVFLLSIGTVVLSAAGRRRRTNRNHGFADPLAHSGRELP